MSKFHINALSADNESLDSLAERVLKEIRNCHAFSSLKTVCNFEISEFTTDSPAPIVPIVPQKIFINPLDFLLQEKYKRSYIYFYNEKDLSIFKSKTGKLNLKVCKEIYYKLGIPGKKSRENDYFILEIQLEKKQSKSLVKFQNYFKEKLEFWTNEPQTCDPETLLVQTGQRFMPVGDFSLDGLTDTLQDLDFNTFSQSEQVLQLLENLEILQILNSRQDLFKELVFKESFGILDSEQVSIYFKDILKVKDKNWIFISLKGIKDVFKSNFKDLEKIGREQDELMILGNRNGFLIVRFI